MHAQVLPERDLPLPSAARLLIKLWNAALDALPDLALPLAHAPAPGLPALWHTVNLNMKLGLKKLAPLVSLAAAAVAAADCPDFTTFSQVRISLRLPRRSRV